MSITIVVVVPVPAFEIVLGVSVAIVLVLPRILARVGRTAARNENFSGSGLVSQMAAAATPAAL